MNVKFNPSSFSPFLEAMRLAESKRAELPARKANIIAGGDRHGVLGGAPSHEPAMMGMLRALAAAPGFQLNMPALLANSGVSLDAFTTTLVARKETDRDTVILTASGVRAVGPQF